MSSGIPRRGRLGMFPCDELGDFRLLEPEEHKAFYSLRFQAYCGWIAFPLLPEGYLPAEDRVLQRASGLDPRQWGQVRDTVLSLFARVVEGEPGRESLVAYRCDRDVAAVELSRKRASSGKDGGDTKAERAAKTIATGVAKQVANRPARRQASGVATDEARRIATGVAKQVANRPARRQASGVATDEARRIATGHAKPVASGVATAVAKLVANGVAPYPDPSPDPRMAVDPAAAAESEDGSRSSLENPPRTPGFPQAPQPDDERARGARRAAGAGMRSLGEALAASPFGGPGE